MEEMHWARWEGARSLPALSGSTTLPTPPHVQQPGICPNLVVQGFLWNLPYVDMID